jgi:lipopolysaccharide assembly LptE-like protein
MTLMTNDRHRHTVSGRLFSGMSLAAMLLMVLVLNSACRNIRYRFNDAAVPANIKTIKIRQLENKASYINPTLSQRLTDRVRQKIVSQTRLTQVNIENPNVDWDVSGVITSYGFTTSGISQGQEATNRLSITIQITLEDLVENKTREYTVNRNFDFRASLSIQQAEASLADEIVRGLSDDIFNRLFSDW